MSLRYGVILMSTKTIPEILDQFEKILKDKPKFNKLLGGSGYRNGYEDGYKHAVKRFKAFRDDILKETEVAGKEAAK
jgi:hypothetical protein